MFVMAVLNSAALANPNAAPIDESVAVPETLDASELVTDVASELVMDNEDDEFDVIVVWLNLFSFLEIAAKYCWAACELKPSRVGGFPIGLSISLFLY